MSLEIKTGYKVLVAQAEAEIETISVEQALALQDDPNVLFVDLRDVRELKREGFIPGAFHAPRGMLEFWVDPESPYYKDIFASDKQFIFYCNLGWRSALATQVVQQMGLSPVCHLEGGFDAWKNAGGPVAKKGAVNKSTMIKINPLTLADEPFLWEMLYQALYVTEGQLPFPPEIVHEPNISRYVQGWGRADDLGFVALDNGKPVGAVWLRLLTGDNRGFGYVDENTPELSIAVLPEYRGKGIGTTLIAHLLEKAQRELRCGTVCLSVSADNPARGLYQKLGFEVTGEQGSSLTMVKRWGR